MLQPASRDVFAIVHAIEADLHDRVISPLHRVGQVFSPRGHTQHAPARGVVRAVAAVRPGMENLHPVHAVRFVNAADDLTRLERAGISAGRHDHAHGWLGRPAEIAIADAALDRRFNGLDQVALHAHHDGLRLRITEAAVEFQHHGAARRHYDAKIQNAFVPGAVSAHARDYL